MLVATTRRQKQAYFPTRVTTPLGRKYSHLILVSFLVKVYDQLFFIAFQKKDSATEFVQRIKKWFMSNDKKWIAICLMPTFLEDFDAEIVWQNLLYWLRSILQVINSKPNDAIFDLTLRCVEKLIKISLEFDDLSREIALNIIQPLLNNLLQNSGTKNSCLVSKISVFRQCMICYPGPTGRFRTQIEHLCIALLSNDNEALKKEACKCMSVLPRCGSSGEKGTKFSEFWSKQLAVVIDTLKLLLDNLFLAKISEDTEQIGRKKTLQFTPVSLAEPEFSTVTSARIKSLLFVMEEMLSYKFPNIVQVDITAIFSLCNRLFDREISHHDTSVEAVCLRAVLPQLWQSMLSLVNVLVAQAGSLLLPFESLITQMANHVLANDPSTGDIKEYKNAALKKQGYQLLNSWNVIVGPLSATVLEKIVDVVLIDIKPQLQKEKTTVIKKDRKHKKMKDGAKLQEDIIKEEMALKMIDPTENSETSFAALTFLATLINTTGPVISSDLIVKIQTEVISICSSLTEPSKQKHPNFPAPYGCDKCRRKLLKCAFELTNLYHHHLPTPLSNLICIFKEFINDPVSCVSADSKFYLNALDKTIRPSVPSLRKYHEDAASTNLKSQLEVSTPSLATGLFDELTEMRHQQDINTLKIHEERHKKAPTKSTAVNNRCNDAQMPESRAEIIPNDTSQPLHGKSQNLSSDEDYTSLVISNHEKLIDLNEGNDRLERRDEESFQVIGMVDKQRKEQGMEVDESEEGTETCAKRPKLDSKFCEAERKSNDVEAVTETISLHEHVTAAVDSNIQNNAELMAVAPGKDEKISINNSDDESSKFLNSFVNSFPDSE